VLLSQPFDYLQELRRIVELLYPIQLDSDQLISAKPAPLDEFEAAAFSSTVTRSGKDTPVTPPYWREIGAVAAND